jgi:hypothetical protein
MVENFSFDFKKYLARTYQSDGQYTDREKGLCVKVPPMHPVQLTLKALNLNHCECMAIARQYNHCIFCLNDC